MKTRRILAASTAALLAFGTTAIISTTASAAAPADDDEKYDGISITIADSVLDASGAAKALADANVTYKANKYVAADGEWGAATEVTSGGTITITEKDTSFEVKVEFAGVSGSETPKFSATKTVKKNMDGEKAPLTDAAGSDVVLADGVLAQIGKDTATKKAFKDLKLSAEALTVVADDEMVNIDDSDVIKKLKDSIKEQFESFKAAEVAVYNLELSDGKVVKSDAPGTVTVKITTSFKPDYVYHVVGDEVEIITGATSTTLVDDGGYQTTFKTKNFSPFILVKGDKIKGAGVSKEDIDPEAVNGGASAAASNTSAATSNGAATTNPDTGIALAIAPVVLAAGAVAVVALKKKH